MSSGLLTYNLVNVKSGEMQVLAYGRAQNYFGQQALCFSKQGSSWLMDFCAKTLNEQNEYEQNWYCLAFRKDLLELLKQYGRLPYDTVTESLREVKQSKETKQ